MTTSRSLFDFNVSFDRSIVVKCLMVKRVFDFSLALMLSVMLILVMAVIAILVRMTSGGPVLHWSTRIGKNNKNFQMPKFRSMRVETPAVASDLLSDPEQWLTPIGRFLRKYSLDELPQLWSVLKGDMSLVGPRPVLSNQHDLILLRTENRVHELLPGLTGWAQVNGRDELPCFRKVQLDAEYLQRQSLLFDLKILGITAVKVITKEGVSH